jgi:hypothetical protein
LEYKQRVRGGAGPVYIETLRNTGAGGMIQMDYVSKATPAPLCKSKCFASIVLCRGTGQLKDSGSLESGCLRLTDTNEATCQQTFYTLTHQALPRPVSIPNHLKSSEFPLHTGALNASTTVRNTPGPVTEGVTIHLI